MRVQDIEIHTGQPDFEFTAIRRLEAKCESATAISAAPSMDEINSKLREMAVSLGANAVIHVKYESGVSWTSWRSMKATGMAVKKQADDIKCPVCAEMIKRDATKCRFCGAEIKETAELATSAVTSITSSSIQHAEIQEPLKATNNPQLWVWVSIAIFAILMFIAVSQ